VRYSSRRATRGLASWPRRNRLEEHELAQATVRTGGPLDLCHALHERGHRFDHCGLRLGRSEGGAGRRQSGALVRGPEQAIVADALEAARQNVLHKALYELGAGQAYCALLATTLAIDSDAKGHLVIVDRDDTLVGDRHAVGVAAQILEHLGRTAEGLLGIHHPVMDIQLALQLAPSRVGERGVLAQPCVRALFIKRGDELAAMSTTF